MKTQLQKLGLGMMLAVLPMMATAVSAQQWIQSGSTTGVTVNLGDSVVEMPGVAKAAHTIVLSDNGSLMGQVASIDASTKSANGLQGLNVFFVQNGRIIKQAQTQADGSFEIEDMPEGAYSFFAAGQAGFAASGVFVTRRSWGDNSIFEASLASSNYSGIQQILQRNLPEPLRQAILNSNQNETTGPAIPSTNQVRLINGRITGQISSLFYANQDVSGIQVHLIQNENPIAQVETNSLGEFIIPDVRPGVYDFVAAGKTSIVVGRFEAIGNSSLMTQASFRKTVTKLEYALALTVDPAGENDNNDSEILFSDGADVLMEGGAGPAEFAGESVGLGGASGGSAGTTGNFSNFSSGPGACCGGGGTGATYGGGGGGGVGLRRLLLIGGVVGGVVGGTAGNPAPQSPVNNN